jgi:hypothetical protein
LVSEAAHGLDLIGTIIAVDKSIAVRIFVDALTTGTSVLLIGALDFFQPSTFVIFKSIESIVFL